MEQRKAQRRPARLDAVVACPQFGLFRGEITNLSEHGLYLKTRLVQVCLNAPVTVIFQPDPDDTSVTCSIDSRVVRQDSAGIGIRFAELDDDNRVALLILLERLSQQGGGLHSVGHRLAV